MKIDVREGNIEEAVSLAKQIPEFIDPAGENIFHQRLDEVRHLILIATNEEQKVGFKVGYDRHNDGKRFYSWMGGVVPSARNMGVATRLQIEMEKWCLDQDYTTLQFKTRNSHRNMIRFALKHDFNLVGFKEKEDVRENRLIFEKELKS